MWPFRYRFVAVLRKPGAPIPQWLRPQLGRAWGPGPLPPYILGQEIGPPNFENVVAALMCTTGTPPKACFWVSLFSPHTPTNPHDNSISTNIRWYLFHFYLLAGFCMKSVSK